MWNFKNNEANGIPYSRYVASYMKTCAELSIPPMYRHMYDWLSELVVNGSKLSDKDKKAMCEMMDNGKLELEANCKSWCEEHKDWYKKRFEE